MKEWGWERGSEVMEAGAYLIGLEHMGFRLRFLRQDLLNS